MVLVGVAFAGVAFAGPTATPPNGGFSTPVYTTSPLVDQSKVGTTPTGASGNKVPHALVVGSYYDYLSNGNDSTVYVYGLTTFGSLDLSADSLGIPGSVTANKMVVNNTVKTTQSQSSVIQEKMHVYGLSGGTGASRALCLDNGTHKVVICQ